MRTLPVHLLVVLPVLVLGACSPVLTPPEGAEDRPGSRGEALRALARWSGAPWRVRYDEVLGTAAYLEGRTAPLGPPDRLGTAARAFLLRFAPLFGLGPDEELGSVEVWTDALGMRHARFFQARDRIPVWGSSLTVHLDGAGALVRVTGRSVRLPLLPLSELAPRLSGETARQLALGHVQGERPEAALQASAPSLWLLPSGGAALLAWRIEVEGQEGALPLREEVFIDASRGAVVGRADLLSRLNLPAPASGSGVGALGERRDLSITQRGGQFYLEDPRRGQHRVTTTRPAERLPGRTVVSKDADRWDAAVAVDVHAHLQSLWDYFAGAHGHYGWAGDGRGVVAVAQVPDRHVIGLFDGRRLVFGEGGAQGGETLAPPGAALDVVAHEYAHAVVRALTGLRPVGESGAVDEGIADLLACLIEQAMGAGADWTVGERVRRRGAAPAPISDLADPRRTDQVRSLREIAVQGAAELAGPASVRVRAGIVAHAGYRVAIRLGTARAAALWYRAIATYLHQFAGFSDVADATLAAAQDLHGGDEEVRAALREAWGAAGVLHSETTGETARP